MEKIDEIRNRIQNRRGSNKDVAVDIEEFEKKHAKPSKLYKMSMLILVIMAMFLSVAVYAKKDENGDFLQEKLGINVNFISFNKFINNLLDFRTVDKITNSVAVSNIPNYVHMGNDMYVNGGSEVTSVDDGVVTYIYRDESGYLVIVENDSGFRSVYSNLIDVSVKVNDRIYFESIIGLMEEKVNIVFSENNEKITYEQVLQLLN